MRIGILFCSTDISPPVKDRPKAFSSYDPLTWNTGWSLPMHVRRCSALSDLDGDTDRLGDGDVVGIILLRRGERTNRMNEIM